MIKEDQHPKFTILPKAWYLGSDVEIQAKSLLGKYLVSNIAGQYCSGMIVETEAYRGADDKACHAYPNKKTKRTEIMFREGGVAYIYLIYGIYQMFNVVTSKEGTANAILVRAIQPSEGLEVMKERRGVLNDKYALTSGPGKLGIAMGISREFNGKALTRGDDAVWLEDRNVKVSERDIIASPRIGVDYAAECANWPWRYHIKQNPWVSR